jgi:1-acyl-sn-glycerol-3-phosphate acyltransferase
VQWFKLSGWIIPKAFPDDLPKYVMVVAPHTSNMDFFVGVAARKLLNIDTKYMAKKELFVFPIKSLMLSLGGYPVNRSKNMSFVDYMKGLFDQEDEFSICITPEGTRKQVSKWKTGFYHIAVAAQVPIILIGFDYAKKWIVISEPFMPSGTFNDDLERMLRFFEKITPKHPENWTYSLEN